MPEFEDRSAAEQFATNLGRATTVSELIEAIERFAQTSVDDAIEQVHGLACEDREFRNPLMELLEERWPNAAVHLHERLEGLPALDNAAREVIYQTFIEGFAAYRRLVRDEQDRLVNDFLTGEGAVAVRDPSRDDAPVPFLTPDQAAGFPEHTRLYSRMIILLQYTEPGRREQVMGSLWNAAPIGFTNITPEIEAQRFRVGDLIRHFNSFVGSVPMEERHFQAVVGLIGQAYDDAWALHELSDLSMENEIIRHAPSSVVSRYFEVNGVRIRRAVGQVVGPERTMLITAADQVIEAHREGYGSDLVREASEEYRSFLNHTVDRMLDPVTRQGGVVQAILGLRNNYLPTTIELISVLFEPRE